MPLYLHFVSSFSRSIKNLDPAQREIVELLLKALAVYLSHGCNLHEAQRIAPRFFFKQLRKPFYETGIEGKLRIVIRRDGENCVVMMAGNHDQVRRFLAG